MPLYKERPLKLKLLTLDLKVIRPGWHVRPEIKKIYSKSYKYKRKLLTGLVKFYFLHVIQNCSEFYEHYFFVLFLSEKF